jgi:hypothetical protein
MRRSWFSAAVFRRHGAAGFPGGDLEFLAVARFAWRVGNLRTRPAEIPGLEELDAQLAVAQARIRAEARSRDPYGAIGHQQRDGIWDERTPC